MKKRRWFLHWVVWPLVVLIVIAAAIAGFVVHHINSNAEATLEDAATAALGVPTTVEDINIAVLFGEAEVKQFRVANPQGYGSEAFMTVRNTDAALILTSLLKQQIEIPYVRLHDVHLRLDKTRTGGNYEVLVENIKKFQGPAPTPTTPADSKRYVIRTLSIEDISVHVTAPNIKPIDVPIKLITLTDIGSENAGMKLSEVVDTIMQAILAAVRARGISGLIPGEILRDLDVPGIDTRQLQKMGFQVIGDAGGRAVGIGGGMSEIGKTIMDGDRNPAQKTGKVLDTVKDETVDTAEQAVKTTGKVIKGIGGMFDGKKAENQEKK